MKNKELLIGIVFIIIFLGLGIYREIEVANENRVNIYDITSSGGKGEGVKVYLDASYVGGVIANYKENDKESFYAIFDSSVQHIVYMKNSDAKRINDYLLDYPKKTYRIIGITRKMPSNIIPYAKEFTKNWLDINHNHDKNENHSHEINDEEFYEYYGYVYLDATTSKYQDVLALNIIFYVTGIIGSVILFDYFYRKNNKDDEF